MTVSVSPCTRQATTTWLAFAKPSRYCDALTDQSEQRDTEQEDYPIRHLGDSRTGPVYAAPAASIASAICR